jgi:hypothetical protein
MAGILRPAQGYGDTFSGMEILNAVDHEPTALANGINFEGRPFWIAGCPSRLPEFEEHLTASFGAAYREGIFSLDVAIPHISITVANVKDSRTPANIVFLIGCVSHERHALIEFLDLSRTQLTEVSSGQESFLVFLPFRWQILACYISVLMQHRRGQDKE